MHQALNLTSTLTATLFFLSFTTNSSEDIQCFFLSEAGNELDLGYLISLIQQ